MGVNLLCFSFVWPLLPLCASPPSVTSRTSLSVLVDILMLMDKDWMVLVCVENGADNQKRITHAPCLE
jgi:hypothetical protein